MNDVYELENLPRLRTLIETQALEQAGSADVCDEPPGMFISVLCGDFVSPSILSGIDAGRGMVRALNMLPITHVCFGNHEADLKLPELAARTAEFGGRWLSSNVEFEPAPLPAYDLLELPTRGAPRAGPPIRVGLIGLLTSESGVFRDDSFRGLEIGDTMESAARWSSFLREECGADAVLALTHQTLGADRELAASGLVDAVLGGHEHEVILEEVAVDAGGGARVVPIVKSGSDAHTAALIDLEFRRAEAGGAAGGANLVTRIRFEEVGGYKPNALVVDEVEQQTRTLKALEEEVVCSVDDLSWRAGVWDEGGADPAPDSRAPLLSSVGTRFRQTTVGALLASACRDALQVRVAAINGGSIKGNRTYESGKISSLELLQELPFPTKMVVVAMPGGVLEDAVSASRRGEAHDERRSYLQLDDGVETSEAADGSHRIRSVGGEPFSRDLEYSVALPRNLMKGLFHIQPLIEFARRCPHAIGAEDAFIPARVLVLRHHANSIWRRLGSFDAIDADGDGVLQRDEIAAALRSRLNLEPTDMLVDSVIRALDADSDGTISREEYERRGEAPLKPATPTAARPSPR